VLNSEDFWIVEFFAPWCGHCQKLAPEYEKAAESLKGIAKLGAVDMTKHGTVGNPYAIQGYPTLKVFYTDKKNPQEYSGGRTAKSIVNYVLKQLGKEVEEEEPEPSTAPLYTEDGPVVHLTEANFATEVLNSEDFWIVEFYAPWCGHCKNLAPEFKKAAESLKGIAKLGAVDMTKDGSVGSPYSIEGYPTLKVFHTDKKNPLNYSGGRTAKSIVNYVLKQLGKEPETFTSALVEEEVYVITDENFDNVVSKSKDVWIIDFYAPWCGHCKSLAPEFAKAAIELKGHVKLGKVDATENSELKEKFKISEFPTLKIFPPENKEEYEAFNNARSADIIVKTALEKLDSYGVSVPIQQFTKLEVLQKNCEKNVCIIGFLPHIYDSSAEERNRYLEVFQEIVKKNRGKPISFLWTQAGDHYKFEQMVGVGMGYPAVIAISLPKSRFALMRAAFSTQEVNTFVNKILIGGVSLQEFKELPKIKEVEAWDGKDKQPEYRSEDL